MSSCVKRIVLLLGLVHVLCASASVPNERKGYYEEQQPVVVEAKPSPSASGGSGYGYDNEDYEASDPSEWGPQGYYSGEDKAVDRGYDGEQDYYRQRFYATTERPYQQNVRRNGEAVDARYPQSTYNNQQQYSPSTPSQSPPPSPATDLLTYVKRAKQIWDIFQAMNTAWAAVGQRQQEQHQHQQQKHVHEPKNVTTMGTKAANETETVGDKEAERKRRTAEADVGEARYIKGDPLKGYYDFVITEGSYKFWAAFQVGTAILIIYSTFAAIYYSKVNPLVSDYDYTDYLGGGRALGDDSDFVDDESQAAPAAADGRSSIWSRLTEADWARNAGHTLQFVLDAVDRLPHE